MARLTMNGKAVKSAPARPAKPAPKATPKPFVDPSWGVVNADPFHVDTDKTPEYRASYLAECGIWQSQLLDELAALARKARRLDDKLRCPDLADNPHRDDAVRKSVQMEADVIQQVRDLIMAEAEADRIWQSLSKEERGLANADFHWCTDGHEPRLIGATWFRLGRRTRWPPGFRLSRQWMSGLPHSVVIDLRVFKVYAWDPNPRPELFPDSDNAAVPTDIATQITDSRGNPR